MNSQHDVVGGGVMGEGLLRVDKKHVGYPDFLHQAAVKGHALVVVASEGQTFIFPVVPQIQGHSKVLKQGNRSLSQLSQLTIYMKYLLTVWSRHTISTSEIASKLST